jgi:hypothetical protein
MMEAINASETSLLIGTTWPNFPEDGLFHGMMWGT